MSFQASELADQLQKIISGKRWLILGVGNSLLGDDGVGSILAKELEAELGREKVRDGGVAPENFLSWVEKFHPDVLIIIDSMEFNKSPGSIGIFSFKELSWGNISTHSLPLSLLWEYLYQRGVKEGYIIGIQPGELKKAGELSPAVEEAKQLVKKIFVNLIKEQEIGSV